ncbi:MAG: rod shape-determining protein MreD [Steroidobacteraceae bacterium]
MSNGGASRLAVWLTVLCGLVLSVVPLPTSLAVLRPVFLVMVVLYWSIMTPRTGGILLGFVGGLFLDVFTGSLLGEHALAAALVTYLAIRLSLLLRAKPLFEQSLFVFAALVIYEGALWAIDGWTGRTYSTPLRWVHTLTGALLWPIMVGIFGRLYSTR